MKVEIDHSVTVIDFQRILFWLERKTVELGMLVCPIWKSQCDCSPQPSGQDGWERSWGRITFRGHRQVQPFSLMIKPPWFQLYMVGWKLGTVFSSLMPRNETLQLFTKTETLEWLQHSDQIPAEKSAGPLCSQLLCCKEAELENKVTTDTNIYKNCEREARDCKY